MLARRSALYAGKVVHQRLKPRRHRLSYRMFFLLLDLDEIDGLTQCLRLLSRNRFGLFSFVDKDHGDGADGSLKAYVERQLEMSGIETGGSIQLLSMPRMLGYAFNPLSIYFCHDRQGALAAILYEVNNTFGQRHSYLIPVSDGGDEGIVRQHCAKRFYVSPFIAMGMGYRFRIGLPAEGVAVHITGSDADGPLIVAGFSGKRRELTDAALISAFFAYPLLTLKVIAGIHWEALLLWAKGMRLYERPAPPHRPVTQVAMHKPSRRKIESDVTG
ncbi:DUF1365 domain-containing protein [Mesorhizobium hawassense]|uniref:DUF1365 domain-containing protein n=1 Tax=Mesorhizobium hawassense TaxID=1209954 RepID=A0A330HV76_9HYPH|nr:DUF1365 domain-containing protein [Mesorhizobium hawassense]RAZ90509.1 DUF1365 domain-containing protein [Mesorhizobium hawassense]